MSSKRRFITYILNVYNNIKYFIILSYVQDSGTSIIVCLQSTDQKAYTHILLVSTCL